MFGTGGGRRYAAPFRRVLVTLVVAATLTACGSLTGHGPSDRMTAVIAGALIELSPQVSLPAGTDVKARLTLRRVSDEPIARDLIVTLTNAAGAGLDGTTVIVVAQMPGMADGILQAAARAEGGGRYVARVVFPMTGTYDVQLMVAGGSGVGSLRFALDIAS